MYSLYAKQSTQIFSLISSKKCDGDANLLPVAVLRFLSLLVFLVVFVSVFLVFVLVFMFVSLYEIKEKSTALENLKKEIPSIYLHVYKSVFYIWLSTLKDADVPCVYLI